MTACDVSRISIRVFGIFFCLRRICYIISSRVWSMGFKFGDFDSQDIINVIDAFAGCGLNSYKTGLL